ncbi:hypothetical protein C5B94_13635 [Clavibacter michiganensis]|nr:hypothetical protein C5B94_13635 [Clavibacter michiganensis]
MFVAGGAVGAVYGKAAPKAKGWLARRVVPDVLRATGTQFTSPPWTTKHLAFHVGDTFTVVECDGETVIIALGDGTDNPWAVSARLLVRISDFPADDDAAAED